MNNTENLGKYLVDKLRALSRIYTSFEGNLVHKKNDLVKISFSVKDFDSAYRRLEDIEGNLFRQAMLVMVLSYLDEAMNIIGEANTSDYSVKISKINTGNWFKKHKKLFKKLSVSFDGIGYRRNCTGHEPGDGCGICSG